MFISAHLKVYKDILGFTLSLDNYERFTSPQGLTPRFVLVAKRQTHPVFFFIDTMSVLKYNMFIYVSVHIHLKIITT